LTGSGLAAALAVGVAAFFTAGRDDFFTGSCRFLATAFLATFFFAVAILGYPPEQFGTTPTMQILSLL
jgi:hypothetical protein